MIMMIVVPMCVLGGSGKATLYRDQIMIRFSPTMRQLLPSFELLLERRLFVCFGSISREHMWPPQLPCWQAEQPQQVSWVQTLNLRGPSCRNLHKAINKTTP